MLDRLHIENSHLPAENVEISRDGQVGFTKALRTATYILRVQGAESRSLGLHKSIENSHLLAKGTDTSRESQVDFTNMKVSHLHAEDAGTSRKGEIDFTEPL